MSQPKKEKTILDLNRYLKVARELGVYGVYYESLEMYKKVLKIIEK